MARKRKASQPASTWHLMLAFLVFFLIIAGISWSDQYATIEKDNSPSSSSRFSGLSLTLYSSPDCSCCHSYVNYLEGRGYSVNFVKTADYLDYFEGVPEDMYSCHIVFGDGYYTVGHIPEAALSKLFNERPALDGISLPGMPAGSPGMGGIKLGSFTIYGITGSQVGEFMVI